jgi:predicted ABC-type ATPase
MFAGPNGSGKTTLYRKLVDQGLSFGHYLNADDIARTNPGAGAEAAVAAQMEVRAERERMMRSGSDYCFETVMSHPSHIDHLLEARKQGYAVQVVYIALEDPVLNIWRVAERVQSGGHDVPEDRVRKRFYRSINNLAAAIIAAHDAMIFDNSSSDRPYDLIASVEREQLKLERDWFELPRWFIPAIVAINAR